MTSSTTSSAYSPTGSQIQGNPNNEFRPFFPLQTPIEFSLPNGYKPSVNFRENETTRSLKHIIEKVNLLQKKLNVQPNHPDYLAAHGSLKDLEQSVYNLSKVLEPNCQKKSHHEQILVKINEYNEIYESLRIQMDSYRELLISLSSDARIDFFKLHNAYESLDGYEEQLATFIPIVKEKEKNLKEKVLSEREFPIPSAILQQTCAKYLSELYTTDQISQEFQRAKALEQKHQKRYEELKEKWNQFLVNRAVVLELQSYLNVAEPILPPLFALNNDINELCIEVENLKKDMFKALPSVQSQITSDQISEICSGFENELNNALKKNSNKISMIQAKLKQIREGYREIENKVNHALEVTGNIDCEKPFIDIITNDSYTNILKLKLTKLKISFRARILEQKQDLGFRFRYIEEKLSLLCLLSPIWPRFDHLYRCYRAISILQRNTRKNEPQKQVHENVLKFANEKKSDLYKQAVGLAKEYVKIYDSISMKINYLNGYTSIEPSAEKELIEMSQEALKTLAKIWKETDGVFNLFTKEISRSNKAIQYQNDDFTKAYSSETGFILTEKITDRASQVYRSWTGSPSPAPIEPSTSPFLSIEELIKKEKENT